jgi:excisionase family DNA binding protein
MASRGEQPVIERIERLLESAQGPAFIEGPDGARTELPRALYEVLVEAIRQLSIGNGVSILPAEMEVTTQRAADILNVSRPHLVKLIKEGSIDHHMVGTHHRLRLVDVIAYKTARDATRRRILAEMVRQAEAAGDYEAFYTAGRVIPEERRKRADAVGSVPRRERPDPLSHG